MAKIESELAYARRLCVPKSTMQRCVPTVEERQWTTRSLQFGISAFAWCLKAASLDKILGLNEANGLVRRPCPSVVAYAIGRC